MIYKNILFSFILTLLVALFAIFMLILFESILENKAEKAGVFLNLNNERVIALREIVPDRIVHEIVLPEKEFVPVGADSKGFLLPSSKHKNPDLTLAFLGGSTTSVDLIRPKARFPYLVEQLLEKRLGIKVRSLNAGASGADSSHSINVLVNKVLFEKPDYVIIMHAINDLNKLIVFNDYWNPTSIRNIILKKYSFRHAMRFFKNRYFPYTYALLRPFLQNFSTWKMIVKANNETAVKTDEWEKYRGKKASFDSASIKNQFKSAQLSMVRIVDSWGITPVLLVQPSPLSNPDLNPPRDGASRLSRHQWYWYNKVENDWGVSREEYHGLHKEFRQIVRNVANETGALLIDLDKEISMSPEFFMDTVHVNLNGSKKEAYLIAEFLENKIRECLESVGNVNCWELRKNERATVSRLK